MESLWEWQKEQILMIWKWLRPMMRYISKSGNLQFWLEQPRCMWTYMRLIGWPPNRRIQYLKTAIEWISNWKSAGSETPAGRWCKYWGGKNYPLRVEEADVLPRSPLPLPHTNWWVGSFAFHSPHGSSGSCHEWMSLVYWMPGSAVNSTFATCLVLVAQNGHTDAESNQQLWAMHPAWMHSYQSPIVTHHCYCSFGVATHWLYQYWDNYGVGLTPPNMVSVLVFCDYFMKHIMAYMAPNQAAKTLLSFCSKDISQSLKHQPSSWVTEEPTL